MHRWKLKDSPLCTRCFKEPETTDHIVLHCPETRLEGGYNTVQAADDQLVSWIDNLKLEV